MRLLLDKPYSHEIHITIANSIPLDTFRNDCMKIGIKPLIIVNYKKGSNERIVDLLTAQKVNAPTHEVILTMLDSIKSLQRNGYEVIRNKIEAAPNHPIVPTIENGLKSDHSQVNYFESHITLTMWPHLKNNKSSDATDYSLKTIINGI